MKTIIYYSLFPQENHDAIKQCLINKYQSARLSGIELPKRYKDHVDNENAE
ncbi:MAG: hypothetical protein SPH22_10690 [Prevotella sp.]|nr:hypothetical protein [Prevotella sp.]MDY5290089.1 hypothetical protein [Prevotella sp.]